MKKVLLDYDNTICDFNKIMVEKWKVLPDLYQKYPFKYEDINLYSLQKCVIITLVGRKEDKYEN